MTSNPSEPGRATHDGPRVRTVGGFTTDDGVVVRARTDHHGRESSRIVKVPSATGVPGTWTIWT